MILMKKAVLFILLTIILSNFISAKTIEEDLYKEKNIEVSGYNITLLSIGSKEKSIVICINNNIKIIDKGNKKTIGDLKIEPLRIYEDYTKLQITYSEDNTCDESCSNTLCFGGIPSEQQTNESKQTNESLQEQQKQQETQQEKNGTEIISIILFLIVLMLLIVLLVKKKR
jgi:hypothetical protein